MTILKQYVKRGKGRKCGLVMAIPYNDGEDVAIAFSKCKNNEKFCPKEAERITKERAGFMSSGTRSYQLPHSVSKTYFGMVERARRVFPESNLIFTTKIQPTVKDEHAA